MGGSAASLTRLKDKNRTVGMAVPFLSFFLVAKFDQRMYQQQRRLPESRVKERIEEGKGIGELVSSPRI